MMLRALVAGVLVILTSGAFAQSANVVAPAAPEQGCATSGLKDTLQQFDDIPTTGKLTPSINRQFSGLGRIAFGDGCQVKITCVAPDTDPASVEARNHQCGAVYGALISFERRPNVRLRLMRSISQVKAPETEVKYVLPGITYLFFY
ncbi:hypothetical protein [uncultured Devosia sp.]|uniref:hypothetical protein n=1 Tax=uncultured Devosia sp. TaxID=211434 RepID=UPI0035CC92DB